MDRRQFIKNATILTCAMCAGCNLTFAKQYDFIYKNKSELPKKILIDACTMCQLNCPQCWRVTCPNRFKKGYLKFADYKEFIDKYSNITSVGISNKGEIFLNPELNKILEFSHDKGVKLSAWSGVNGNYIPDNIAELLVKTDFQGLTFSIDGATNEVYKIYRVGGNIENVFENIRKINFYKKKYKSKYPFMTYKFIVFGHNEHEIPLAKEKAKKLGIPIYFEANYAPQYSPIRDKKFVEKETGMNFSDRNDQYVSDWKKGKRAFFPCKNLWLEPIVNFDGEFFGCCYEADGKTFGDLNIFKQDYLEIMNSETLIYAKKMLTDFNTPAKENIPCSKCEMYKKLKKCGIKLTDEV